MKLTMLVFLVASVHTSLAADDFYKGKTMRIIVAASPGGGFDAYARVIARHLGKHIPGNPNIIVLNMPGGGTRIAANYVYHKAAPDGLTIGNWAGGLILQQVMGQKKGIEFDGRRFEWVGVAVQDSYACALTKKSGIESMQDWTNSKKPVQLGGIGPGTSPDDIAKVLKDTVGLPIQLVSGYKGSSRIRLAAEQGELDGGCWTWDSIKTTWKDGLESGAVNVILQVNDKKHPNLPDVPNAIDYVKAPAERQVLQTAIHDRAAILRSYSLPPGTPADRVRLLQEAFMATMKDPEFLQETDKLGLTVDPLPGDKVADIVQRMYELDPAVVTKMKQALEQK